MSLPTSSTNVLKTIPSYLYFQYIDDPDLPALIKSYNDLTQEYVDWFNDINLPVYTGLSGAMLDWVGQGVYGIKRPRIATSSLSSVYGPVGGVYYHGPSASGPVPNMTPAIDTFQIKSTSTTFDTPDDIYKRVLTWWFYKGDGLVFTIPWLKRRIARFLYGVNGTDISHPYTPDISVTFNDSTSPLPTCVISIAHNSTNPVAVYLKAAIENGYLSLPFRFTYTVTLT